VTCKYCGTEIAGNALLCYRCGHATEDAGATAVRAPRPVRRTNWIAGVGAVILVIAALYMGRSTYAQVPRELSWTIAALAIIVLVWRLFKRGRR
jgi:hypothetical protein